MAVYLVDYENTKDLTGIGDLGVDDRVIIFYSAKANTLTFDVHKEILKANAVIDYMCAGTGGQNALDFQLSTYLGYLIGSNEEADESSELGEGEHIYIVSKDKGFAAVVDFWKREKGIVVKQIGGIVKRQPAVKPPEMPIEQYDVEMDECASTVDSTEETYGTTNQSESAQGTPSRKQNVVSALENSGIDLTEEQINEITKIAMRYKSGITINGNINKLLKDSAKSGEVFRLIKPYLNIR